MKLNDYLNEAKKITIKSTLEYGDMPEVFEFADELDVLVKTVSKGIELTGKKNDVAEMLAFFNRWTLKELTKRHSELKGAKISGELYPLEEGKKMKFKEFMAEAKKISGIKNIFKYDNVYGDLNTLIWIKGVPEELEDATTYNTVVSFDGNTWMLKPFSVDDSISQSKFKKEVKKAIDRMMDKSNNEFFKEVEEDGDLEIEDDSEFEIILDAKKVMK